MGLYLKKKKNNLIQSNVQKFILQNTKSNVQISYKIEHHRLGIIANEFLIAHIRSFCNEKRQCIKF